MSRRIDLEVWMDVEKEDEHGNILDCFEVLVKGEYVPAEVGSRDHYGAQMEPDLPARVEFLEATRDDGEEYELNKEEMRRAESLLEAAIPDLD